MKKREFLKNVTLAGLSIPFAAYTSGKGNDPLMSSRLSGEDDWTALRHQFILKQGFINLENGYYSILPQPTLTAYHDHIQRINEQGSHYMRNQMQADKLDTRNILAGFLQCPAEELIITRNTTESMDTVISGTDWKPGEEAIMAEQDYGSMLDMFRQQARRYGMKNIMLSIPNHPASDEEIVALYRNAITPRTRLIMLSHIINITGQVLPVKKICQMARQKGVKVLVDGAHAVAHIDFRITELGCDYYASSLHKWLGAPLGSGCLYVRKSNIASLWPLFGDSSYADDDIRKLNHTGTQPMGVELSIRQAVDFHNAIGSKKKEDRLRFLQTYWTSRVRNIPGIIVNTPADPARNCGIANVGLRSMKPAEMARTLMETYRIWTVAIDHANVQGCRITPHVFTTTQELDVLVDALKEMNRQ